MINFLRNLFKYLTFGCIHEWVDINEEERDKLKLTPIEDGASGYCQYIYKYKCVNCGKEKSHYGDCYVGFQLIDDDEIN